MKKQFYWILLFLVSFIFSINAYAQTTISGKVIDEGSKEPLPGVTVVLKSTTAGTATDLDGNFAIGVKSLPATFIVTYLGYKTEEVDVYEYTQSLTIELSENRNFLSEVVVVGYGTQKRKELTGAVATVNKEALSQLSTSFESLLGGTVSGLNVTQTSGLPGAGFSIRIRGSNSVTAANEPLYVIDGVIVYDDGGATSSASGTGVTRVGGRIDPLASINPGDIESVEVLKDVSATAIYGSRGANGVIIITTKSGKKGKNNIEYQYSIGVQQVAKKLDLLNASDWAKLNQEIYQVTDNDKGEYYGWSEAQLNALGKGTNYQDAALRTAASQTHQLTISGGDEKTRYLLSGNYTDQNGIIINTDFQRYTGRFNFERDLFSNLTVGITANAGKLTQNGLADYAGIETGGASNSLSYVILIPQTVPIYNADGTYNYNNVHEKGDLRYGDRTVNAISDLNNTVAQSISNTLIGNFFANWAITPNLKARINVGTNLNNTTQNFFGPSSSAAGFLAKGYGSIGNKRTDSWLYEYTLNYTRQLNKDNYIDVLGGYTTQTSYWERTTVASTRFSNETLTYHNLQASEGLLAPVTDGARAVLNSYLGRVNYTLKKRYNLTATLRADGSSRWAPGHQWGYFPSVGLAWNVNEESFLRNNKVINDLKLRASLGTVGNQEIGDYRFLNTYNTVKYSFNNNIVIGYVKGNRENPDLTWETTASYNVGADFSLLKHRLSGSLDAYYKNTNNLLLEVPVERTSGYASILKNAGSVINKGLEFELRGDIISRKNFNWNVSANIAKNINEVAKAEEVKSGSTILQKGTPFGAFYGLVFDGIVQNDAEAAAAPVPTRNKETGTPVLPGDVRYKDQNQDNQIDLDHDRVVLGSPHPDFVYGFSTSLRYKDLTFFAAFAGNQGNELYNALRRILETPDPRYNGVSSLLDRWTPANHSNTVPKAVIKAVTDLDSRYIEDASFLKLKTLSVNYVLPFRLEKAPTTRFKVFAAANNLLTFTKYKGYDPEVAGGTDSGVYPTSRSFTFGINISY
ncbi:SusC/RagA family TonB-linked outer membrane protein [Bacteroidia bacterium]|nr:SusC/RagA family TonB-linked outer membrane protein [Bacteroidia bacterium]GHT46923.1 SusC/RagA family TonB-linked outer membrane protein [Bacteroidia bacterium]